jgi:hypothetical protein
VGEVSYAEVKPNYLRDHLTGSIALGVIALAAYIQSLDGPPKDAWEWGVVALIGAATFLKAFQSVKGSEAIAPRKE